MIEISNFYSDLILQQLSTAHDVIDLFAHDHHIILHLSILLHQCRIQSTQRPHFLPVLPQHSVLILKLFQSICHILQYILLLHSRYRCLLPYLPLMLLSASPQFLLQQSLAFLQCLTALLQRFRFLLQVLHVSLMSLQNYFLVRLQFLNLMCQRFFFFQ